ncbi:LACI-type transcriptional regulator [Shigella flexneri]|nr:LACI-type transcriptional regulator [Shigella flexneri]SRP13509.1 LACI-type transcriptional regulator [Shigella flexneri]SVG80413.1 LACI-type transcriptional regulator [Shigella flexneri]SVG93218.1 LACI-type transcriptional regulator [Shigella flexneri 2a]
MPKKMRTTRNLLLMATLLGSALFARAADKEMTIGAIYLDTQGYYAGVRQGVQDAAKDSSVQVQLIETNAQGDISKESTFVDTLVARNVDAIILSAVSENGSSRTVRRASEAGIPVICYNTCINQKGVDKYVSAYLVGDSLEFGKNWVTLPPIILLPIKLTSRKLPSSIAKPLKFVCSDVKDLKKY